MTTVMAMIQQSLLEIIPAGDLFLSSSLESSAAPEDEEVCKVSWPVAVAVPPLVAATAMLLLW